MLWRGKSHSTPMFTLLKIHQQFIFKLFLRLTYLFLLALIKFILQPVPGCQLSKNEFFTFKGLILKKKEKQKQNMCQIIYSLQRQNICLYGPVVCLTYCRPNGFQT